MPAPGQSWPLDFKAAACVFHSIAIASGIFRTAYRWHISRFGWEDIWALLALFTDTVVLICLWIQQSASLSLSKTDKTLNYIVLVTVTSVIWEARLSMIAAIIRITSPHARTRSTCLAVAVSFGLMWMAVLAQKLYVCATNVCHMTHGVAISQLTTDMISDALLVILPIFFLRGMKISQSQRVLLISSFASSILITIISIAHSITLFMPLSSTSVLVFQIKAALSVIICNLLIIVAFAYRYYHKTDVDITGIPSQSDHVQFTTVIRDQMTFETCTSSTSQLKSVADCTSITTLTKTKS